MANLKHVTPRYIVDRLSVVLDEKRHPNHPWLTKDSVELLGQLLRKQDVGVEFGSGRSTHWFLSKIASITSIETHEGWFKKVSQDCESEISSKRMVYHLASDVESFLTIIDGFDSDSIDFCLVDGSHRDTCALSMVPKIKTGGLMVVDNINWYIPCENSTSPNARRIADGYASEKWEEFAQITKDWRYIWTSNGVSDTGIWIRT
ncbi:class I SAM-dependent methyltransferase [Sulfitobacter sp.]|uniref:class I SAM-dependent methyltransferase n=1 Tax=Sulfitobacter sp. TaxID=1903071 RepID=UPI003F6B5CD6